MGDEIKTEEEVLEEEQLSVKSTKKWRKVVLAILAAILILAMGGSITFAALRTRGEKKLKTKVAEVSQGTKEDEESESEDGHYISYNGKEYKYREDVINILCMGVDKETKMEQARKNGSYGLADAILLVSIDTKQDKLKIIAVPRDTMTNVQMVADNGSVVEEQKMPICFQYSYGKSTKQAGELMADTVSKLLYLVPIQRYCAINFKAIPVLNDAVGGVDVEVLEDMTWWRKEFVLGRNLHLKGDLALDYIRQRNETKKGSNLKRIERQKQYITEFLTKSKKVVKKDMSLPVTVFKQMRKNMSTNITVEDITYLVPELLNMEINVDEIRMIPGEVVSGKKYEEYYADEEAVKELVIDSFYEEIKDEKAAENEVAESEK